MDHSDLMILATDSTTEDLKSLCQQWQYKPSEDVGYVNHSDMVCIAYNYCFLIFDKDPSQYLFKEEKFVVNFKEMTEIVDKKERKIRRLYTTHLRLRKTDADQLKAIMKD